MSNDSGSEERFVRFLRNLTDSDSPTIGDDCAVLDDVSPSLLATVDCMVRAIHYTSDATPEQLAQKLIGINFSDIAAMGGQPKWVLLESANQRPIEDQETFVNCLVDTLEDRGVRLVGGDLSGTPSPQEEYLSLTVLGHPTGDHLLLRRNAKPGDKLVVSGSLGGVRAILSGGSRKKPESSEPLYRIPDRLNLGRAAVSTGVRCGIDVSDGLVKDLSRVCEASEVGVSVDYRSVPIDETARTLATNESQALQWALDGGEDFELLLAVPADRVGSIEAEVELTEIGEFTEESGVSWDPELPEAIDPQSFGYDHFEGS